MPTPHTFKGVLSLLLCAVLVQFIIPGCMASDTGTGGTEAAVPNGGFAGLGSSGSQDFGLFRSILESGGIPGSDTIDDVGFFAAHKLEFPAPECGEDVCLHGSLGVLGNMMTGTACTMVMFGICFSHLHVRFFWSRLVGLCRLCLGSLVLGIALVSKEFTCT